MKESILFFKAKKSYRLWALCISVLCFVVFFSQGIMAETPSYSWANFRGNDENNAVVDIKTPITPEDAVLYWAVKCGEGYDTSAPSSPIIVDNTLVFTSKTTIYKVDTVSGETIATGEMCKRSNFNITPPTYADGKIFVALKEGTIQAFDAETLESLWVYNDALKGQPNSPITYYNGCVYTGFWNSEDSDAAYVCIQVEDGDTTKTDEEKTALWRYVHAGGFYWAGSYVTDNYLLVGSDNGVSGNAQKSALLALNPATGKEIDTLGNIEGDIRSSISFDTAQNRCYFTSKGGYFYSVIVNEDGTFDDDSLKSIDLGGMSTSTPTVYNGRAYVGVAGTGQFTAYSNHHLAVIDLTAWEIAYTCPTQGYPQTSGLLTTAYQNDSGYVYIYFFDNYTPGKLRVLKDKPGQTTMLSDSPYAPILFTPAGDQAQYAICSPIVDEYGTVFFKNDSAHMMALGCSISKIEITTPPTKTTYTAGETFDPTGMKVTAYYSNGKTRDISAYVSCADGVDKDGNPTYTPIDDYSTPLTTDDLELNIYFAQVMYHDTGDGNNNNDENKVNQKVPTPYATVELDVSSDEAVENAEALISALQGKIDEAGVAAAKQAYDRLSATEKGRVSNADILTAALAKIKDTPFKDLDKGAWYYDEAYFAYWNNLITGTEATTFSPDTITTRGMLVTILYRYSGSPEVSGAVPFTDLKQDYYKNPILWAYQNGIVNGTGATTFSPEDKITREQLATILYRYCGEYKKMDVSASASLGTFPDSVKVSDYAQTALKWAVAKGYISGSNEGGVNYILPQNGATRAQVAAIMMRFIKSI